MADPLAVADAARIASLEEEVVVARERARSQGDELEALRRQVCSRHMPCSAHALEAKPPPDDCQLTIATLVAWLARTAAREGARA